MPLFDRGSIAGLGDHHPEAATHSLYDPEQDPFSKQFQPPKGISSVRGLMNYLLAVQRNKFGELITAKMSYPALQGHAGLLLKRYPVEVILRATFRAAQVAGGPFSWKYVEEHTIPEVIARCLFLDTTTGNSPARSTRKKSDRR